MIQFSVILDILKLKFLWRIGSMAFTHVPILSRNSPTNLFLTTIVIDFLRRRFQQTNKKKRKRGSPADIFSRHST